MAAAGYQLKSDLARVCLPAPGRTVPRRLAWANSISLLFLLIGVLGSQSRLPALQTVPPLEQPVAVIIEPLPPVTAPATEANDTGQQSDDDKPQVPSIQAVTLDTPAINFAVPTAGSLLVASSVAPVPGEVALKKTAPVNHEPKTVQNTGEGGDRPQPKYPKIAEQLGIQGDVTLLLTVNDAGQVVSTEIKESSGSPILDEAARDWVKRHWVIPPADGVNLFLITFHYHFKSRQ